MSTSSRGSPISSSASRNAVVRRSSASKSGRPPGNEISPACLLRSSRRFVKTAWRSPPCTYSGTSTAASFCPPEDSISAASSGVRSSSRRRSGVGVIAPAAARLGQLDRLLEHDLALERAVHRALRGDLGQTLALLLRQLLGQPQRHLELGGRAALGRLVVDVHGHVADVPALALGVHLDRDRRTRGERHGQHLLRVRALVVTAVVLTLVDSQRVAAYRDRVLVTVVSDPMRVRLHHLPPALNLNRAG